MYLPFKSRGRFSSTFTQGGLMNVVQKLLVAKKTKTLTPKKQYFSHCKNIILSFFKCSVQDMTCFHLFCKTLVILSREAVTRHSCSDRMPHTNRSHSFISTYSLHHLISFLFQPHRLSHFTSVQSLKLLKLSDHASAPDNHSIKRVPKAQKKKPEHSP